MLHRIVEAIKRVFVLSTSQKTRGFCEALQQGWTLALRLNDQDIAVDLEQLVTARFSGALEEAANLQRAYRRLLDRAHVLTESGYTLDPAWEYRMMALEAHIRDVVVSFLNGYEVDYVLATPAYDPQPFRRILLSPDEISVAQTKARIEREKIALQDQQIRNLELKTGA